MFDSLLLNLTFPQLSDSQNFLALNVIISRHLSDNPNATCSVYQISSGIARQRSVGENGNIKALFQGAAPVNPIERRGEIYPGDVNIHDPEQVTIQIHCLDLRRNGEIVHTGVPAVAVWTPNGFSNDVMIQNQGGVEENNDD